MAASLINLPFVEIEVRLGCMDKHFDPAIDYNHVKTIVESLNFYDKWKRIDYINSSEYIFSSENMKLIESTTNGKEVNIKLMFKENRDKQTIVLKDSPFDIRFVVNQEFTMNHLLHKFKKENANIIRHKQRKSYIADNFKYDITNVTEVTNNTPITKYEIEIELLVNKQTINWTDDYIQSYLTCKINDLINLVEPSKNELIINFKKCSIK
jgi:hypothetical protein